ncbi:hypothetical protein IFM89_005949 [Coptis chinensis]|uniref:Uncharacterized protein n=1 Tax=Coptis chinensis TaxID=261450 RepID=A0A835LYN7_9MAGN|nr:hypothetical protein IFM89_005949 [Coptis chinensis]
MCNCFVHQVIYFGDHLFSDLRGPSKAGCIAAAIIHELEAKFHIIQELLGKLHATAASDQRSETCGSLLKELNEERELVRSTMKNMFNSSFGATFLTDTGQESAFAYNIHQYADVYTSAIKFIQDTAVMVVKHIRTSFYKEGMHASWRSCVDEGIQVSPSNQIVAMPDLWTLSDSYFP